MAAERGRPDGGGGHSSRRKQRPSGNGRRPGAFRPAARVPPMPASAAAVPSTTRKPRLFIPAFMVQSPACPIDISAAHSCAQAQAGVNPCAPRDSRQKSLRNAPKIGMISSNSTKERKMKKYVCDVCGWIYDPEVGDPDSGVAPGTAFEDIPDDWECPECGVGKDDFSVLED